MRTRGLLASNFSIGQEKCHDPQTEPAYVRVFGIDKDRELVIVPKGKYVLVVNTKWDSKKKNVRRVEDYVKSRREKR